MQKNHLPNSSIFEEELKKFNSSKLRARLQEKFRIKPFYEKEHTKRVVVLYASMFLNIFSIATSFLFVNSLLSDLSFWVTFPITFILLAFIELLKRIVIAPIAKDYLQFKKLSYLPMLFGSSLIIASALFSYKGANLAVEELSTPPIAINADSIKSSYQSQINELKAQQKELMKVKYQGTTTRTAQKTIEALQKEALSLQAMQEEELKRTNNKNDEITQLYTHKKKDRALYFALLALCLDFFLIVSVFYLEYYDYRSLSEFSELPKIEAIQVGTVAVSSHVEPFDQSNQIGKEELCLSCGQGFEKRAHNQKFCSEQCRIEAYEQRTGKRLKYQPNKTV